METTNFILFILSVLYIIVIYTYCLFIYKYILINNYDIIHNISLYSSLFSENII